MNVRAPMRLAVVLGVCLTAATGIVLLWSRLQPDPFAESTPPAASASEDLAARLARLEARERRIDETAWAPELLAQRCGLVFDDFWDALNAASNKLAWVAEFPAREWVPGDRRPPQPLAHGIQVHAPGEAGPVLEASAWRRWVHGFADQGWELGSIELRHVRFDTNAAGQPAQSRFYCAAHLTHPARAERALLDGELVVDWEPATSADAPARVRRIDARGLVLKTRSGEPPFTPILIEAIAPPAPRHPIDPLLLYDLDGDGLPEPILPAKNHVYRRDAAGRYTAGPLCHPPPGLLFASLIADFDGDGAADLLCVKAEGLILYRGTARTTFDAPPALVWAAPAPLLNPMALTCGDADGDGDADVFLGQYRVPTLGTVLEPHYYDANDGDPAYLLRNDGHGHFADITAAAGLEAKRHQRTYAASFVDLDTDGDLDLLVVSDFAGLNLYRNEGQGRFTDVTGAWVAEPQAFGMAHTFADFNADGHLDLLMIGMNSPTVDRLEHLGLRRPDATDDPRMRPRMAFGNRLLLARPDGPGFAQTPLNDGLARSGWSWGCAAFDLDNDGFPEVYIANGHETRASVRDYEPEFWLHDLYVDRAIDDATASAYFLHKHARTRGRGWSYGGYERNRLYLSQRGTRFWDVGHLLNVSLAEDSRNVAAGDLDGDGRVDLAVTTYEGWPESRQTLRVWRNTLDPVGRWIGFRFRETARGLSLPGTRVTLVAGGRTLTGQVVTGDSFRSQHPPALHFGLGDADQVDRADIHWPGGSVTTLRNLASNRCHLLEAPARSHAP